MKKKFFVTVLSLMMVTSLLAGCGKTNSTEPTNSTEETLEETLDDFSDKVDAMDKTDEDSADFQDGKKDNDKADEKNTDVVGDAKDTLADDEAVVLDREYTAEDVVASIDPTHFGLSISAEGLTMKVANVENSMMMSYSVYLPADVMQTMVDSEGITGNFDMDQIVADGGMNFECAVYQIDGEAYCYSNMSGEDEYFKISDSNSETTQSFFTEVPDTGEMGMSTDQIDSAEYVETIKYNNKSVDVVRIVNASEDGVEAETFDLYIDPETGMAVAMVMPEADELGNDMIIDILTDDVVLPSEFEGCGEDTSTKAAEYLFGVMMLPMYMAQ